MLNQFFIFRNGIWMFGDQLSKIAFDLGDLIHKTEYFAHKNSVCFVKTPDMVKSLVNLGHLIPLEDNLAFGDANDLIVESLFSGNKSLNLIGDYVFTKNLPILNVFTITHNTKVSGDTERKTQEVQKEIQKEIIRLQNYYDFLDVDRDLFSEEHLKKQYKKLLFKFHPDHGGKHDEFIYFKEAYNILSDANKRKKYDFTLKLQESKKHKTQVSEYDLNAGNNENSCKTGVRPIQYLRHKCYYNTGQILRFSILNTYGIDYKGTLSIKQTGELKCN